MFAPAGPGDLGICYLIWIGIFIILNISWDIGTPKTKPFHIVKLKDKTGILHHGASFCSSLLLIVAIFDPKVWDLAKESYIPIILAGASGILTSIPAICPYKLDHEGNVITSTS
jgi:hypothetical protein